MNECPSTLANNGHWVLLETFYYGEANATYFMRVTGDSMIEGFINEGDMPVVDCSITAPPRANCYRIGRGRVYRQTAAAYPGPDEPRLSALTDSG